MDEKKVTEGIAEKGKTDDKVATKEKKSVEKKPVDPKKAKKKKDKKPKKIKKSRDKLYAYTNRIIKINLDTQTVEEYPFSKKDYETFLGGKILAAKILYDNILTKVDAFSADNMIVISTSPLTGMGSPSASRFNISSISPLTGYLASSNCGGSFGLNLKKAGFDAIILVGKCKDKTWISINNGVVEFHDATDIWGMHTGEAQENMGAKRAGKIVIGPAGENLVKYACVISEERAAGRGGMGAVFGSKNLKGITAEGKSMPELYDPDLFKWRNKQWVKRLTSHPTTGIQLPALGTGALLAPMQARNLLATKNFSTGKFEGFEEISGEALAEQYVIKKKGCLTCPMQCGRQVKYNDEIFKGPEVEVLGLMGANICNKDLGKIVEWNHLFDELGMDAISCAGSIAFAMELNESGKWNSGLEFGKNDNISQILDNIAHRRGEIGDILADGSKIMGERFNDENAMQVKGMEISAYEPRAAVGQGLGYAISNRGGCHLNAGYMVLLEGLGLSLNQYTTHSKAALTSMFQDVMESVSAGGNCLFTAYAFFPKFLMSKPNGLVTRIVNKVLTFTGPVLSLALRFPWIMHINLPNMLPHPLAISAATGMKLTMGSMLAYGERGINLERALNVRLGMRASDDSLPKRLTTELQQPDNPKSVVPLDKLKKRYYKIRRWDQNAVPKKHTLKRLKITT